MKDKFGKQYDLLEHICSKGHSQVNREADFGGLVENLPESVYVYSIGKSAHAMALSFEQDPEVHVRDGILISNEAPKGNITSLQQFQASHPYPDIDSLSASLELVNLAKKIPAGETVVFCVSGGTSSLFCIPAKGIEIEELAETYELLLNSGASIQEINCVRKHLSDVKGGQLAHLLKHTRLITIAISDVPGDDLDVIGSGPTIHDSSTFKDAFKVLKRYQLWDTVPHAIRIHISKGMYHDIPDTPKPGVDEHPNHEVILLTAANTQAQSIGDFLKSRGYNVFVSNEAYVDDVRVVSKMMCSQAISILSKNDPITKPAALVFFGESTVHVTGSGKGGRNQELALASAISVEGQHTISMLSFATDGIDGPTDSAGTIVSSQTTLDARKRGLDPEAYLQNNDSYSFFEELDTHIKIGPTGNNLMDLQVVLIE